MALADDVEPNLGSVAPADVVTPDSTSQRLVAAAIEVFAEKGYDGAGVAEIARRAGLTTGAIYSRFGNKAELLAEAISASGGDELDRLFDHASFRGRANDLFALVGSHLIDRGLDTNRALLLEAFTAARRDPEVAAALRARLADRAVRLGELIDQSKRNGLVDPSLDTAAIVHFAHAVGLGFVLFDAIGADQPDASAWEQLIGHLVASVVPDNHVDAPPLCEPVSTSTNASGVTPQVPHQPATVPGSPATSQGAPS